MVDYLVDLGVDFVEVMPVRCHQECDGQIGEKVGGLSFSTRRAFLSFSTRRAFLDEAVEVLLHALRGDADRG